MLDESVPNLWYEDTPNDHKISQQLNNDESLLIRLKDEAKKCLDSDAANYNIRNSKKNSNHQWMKTMISKGTVSDKIAAYVVSIQDSPLHNLELLSNLVSIVKVGKKKECVAVIENLVELFLESLLPPTRKLILFRERPLMKLDELSSGNTVTRRKHLMYWYFEDQLKETYAIFVRSLNNVAHDTVDNNKEKALGAMHKLLANNSEQEKNLLSCIINKIGDPSKKVASKSVYCLTQLLHRHSNMQGVVLAEIEKLLFRPNISPRAQYYALCFLSQFYLSHESNEVARHLIEVYFSFFKACIKKGDVNSRTMAVLLMGVNRAYPYAKMELEKIASHIDTMYRIVHVASFNISLHALSLLFQVSDQSSSLNDRFFSALYRKLLDPEMSTTTHHAMLLSLIFKALNKDVQLDRVKVFIKRLLQVAMYMQPSVSCGILYVVSQLLNKRPTLSSLILKPSSFDVHDEDDNEEERYTDVKDEEDENQHNLSIKETTAPSWVHGEIMKKTPKKTVGEYDGIARNPLYAGGQFCTFTELDLLRQHFHPTVSLYASNVLNGETIKYSGDPLKDFSLIRFLDRFAFKNPKQPDVVAKLGCHPTFGKRKKYTASGARSIAVNSNSYLNEQQQNIPVEELFLYTYLKKRYKDQRPTRGEDEDDSDLESVASAEFEEMLDKMTSKKMGEDDDDEDEDEEKKEETLDYMDAVGENLKSDPKSKKNKKRVTEEDDDSDNASNNEDNDEFSDLETDDDNESDIVFDSAEEGDENKASPKKKLKKNEDTAALFASADEFAALLDEEGISNVKPGSSNAWANKDKANQKQIAWEEKRNHWLKGYDGKMKSKGGRRRPFMGKNISKQREGNKKKMYRSK